MKEIHAALLKASLWLTASIVLGRTASVLWSTWWWIVPVPFAIWCAALGVQFLRQAWALQVRALR